MAFKELIVVYTENHTKYIDTKHAVTDWERRWINFNATLLSKRLFETDF
jgi:hypothetical protein